MAIVKDNVITKGVSGMYGGAVVFRQYNGKTIIASRPRKPQRESGQQRENRNRFRDASAYAKTVLEDAQKKAYYTQKARQLKLPNAYTAAITDYMRRPAVVRVKTTSAGTGYVTIITRKQGFGISSVRVTLADSQGHPLGTCEATRQANNGMQWQCHLPAHLSSRAAVIQATVTDAPGNTIHHQLIPAHQLPMVA